MAVRFDATTDQIERTTAPDIGTSGFTFTAWVYLAVDRNDYSTMMRLSAGGGTRGNVAADSNGQTLAYFTIDGSLTSSTTMTAGNWYRVAISIPSTGGSTATGTLYTATAAGATSSASGTVSAGNDADRVTIGGRGNGDTSEWWNGRVAHARMWEAALSQAEVEAEWASTTPVRTSGLWADWPLLVHTDLTDASGNGRNLSAGSTATTTEADPPLGGSVSGDVALASTFGVTASATRGTSGDVTAASTFAITAAATRGAVGDVAVASTFGLTASADVGIGAEATLASTFAITVTASATSAAGVALGLGFAMSVTATTDAPTIRGTAAIGPAGGPTAGIGGTSTASASIG